MGEESSALDGCQHTDSVSSEMETATRQRKKERTGNICTSMGSAGLEGGAIAE